MNKQSAVEFKGTSRIHIGLNVLDIPKSRAFYEILLQTSPSKERSDYVKFEPQEPSVNLSLNQISSHSDSQPPSGHFGVQVQTTDAVAEAIQRFKQAGLETRVQESTACCYAVQNKVWVNDPDGNEWEVFVVLEADTSQRNKESSCCTSSKEDNQTAACC